MNTLPPLSPSQLLKHYRISPTKYISLSPCFTSLSIYSSPSPSSPSSLLLSTFSLPPPTSILRLSLCLPLSSIFLYTSDGELHQLSLLLTPQSLPLCIGNLHMLEIDPPYIIAVDTEGFLKVYDVEGKKERVEVSVMEGLIGDQRKEREREREGDKKERMVGEGDEEGGEAGEVGIEYVGINEKQEIIVTLTTKKRFVLSSSTLTWHPIPLQIPDFSPLQPLPSPLPSPQDALNQLSKPFFETLIRPPSSLTPLMQSQYNLLYLRSHSKDTEKYGLSLVEYVKELAKARMDSKLREVLLKVFVQKEGEWYLKDEKEGGKAGRKQIAKLIKGIPSGVISEFFDLDYIK